MLLLSMLSCICLSAALDSPFIRAIHASSDTPPVDIYLNGTDAVSNLAFGDATLYDAIKQGNLLLEVKNLSGSELLSANLPIDSNSGYSALVIGSSINLLEKLEALLIADPGNLAKFGKAKVDNSFFLLQLLSFYCNVKCIN